MSGKDIDMKLKIGGWIKGVLAALKVIPFLLTIILLFGSQPVYAQELKVVEHYYPNGQMAYQYTYYDGPSGYGFIYHGTYTMWEENGQIAQQGVYVDGKKNGIWTGWGILDTNNEQRSYQTKYEYGVEIKYTEYYWYSNRQMAYQKEYLNSEIYWDRDRGDYRILHGISKAWSRSGKLSSQKQYVYGKLNGISTFWYDDSYAGWPRVGKEQIIYKDGKMNGLYTNWNGNGQLGYQCEYKDDKKNGSCTAYRLDGNLELEGQYSNGLPCGIFTVYDIWYGTEYITYPDYGPCEPFAPSENTYSSQQTNQQKEIRGRVYDAKTGDPISGAAIGETTSDNGGFYKLTLGDVASYSITCSKDGYYTYSDTVSMTASQYKTINIKLKKKSARPTITNVKSKYGSVFLYGASVTNEYIASVDWNGEPGKVKFDVNGKVYEAAGTATGASQSFNMGSDFIGSIFPEGNILKITAINKAGDESASETLHPVILPIPAWAVSLGTPFGTIKYGDDVIEYTDKAEYPEEPLEIQINEKTLGPTLWKAWSLFPLIGGRNFGIPPTQAFYELGVKSDGSGSITCGGKMGFEAAGQEIGGKLGGKGELQYEQGKGLSWRGASLIMGVEGKIKKEVGPVTLIPALEGAVNLPFIGRAIAWFNNKAKIEGNIEAGADVALQVISAEKKLGFHKTNGEIKAGMGLGLSCDISEKIKAELSAGGMNTVGWQVPANPNYIESIKAELSAKLKINAYMFESEFEAKHAFDYPADSSKGTLSVKPMSSPVLKPISRDFLRNTPYNYFSANKGMRKPAAAAGATEWKIIQNVYPYSEPVIAEKDGKIGIAFVYFDPNKPTLQATDIYFTYYNGASYAELKPIKNDTRAEFAPSIAFDQNGKVVSVWERIRDENFTSASIEDMVKRMEIVYAVYDPSTSIWSEPIPLTDNDYIDHSPNIARAKDGRLLLIWQSNSGNQLIGNAEFPSEIHYALWNGNEFGSIKALTNKFQDSFNFSHAYSGEKGIISYVKDMDGNLITTEDQEIFYISFDGTNWGGPIRLTNDSIADSAPNVLYKSNGTPELIWLKGETLVRLTDWNNGNYQKIREGSKSVTFTNFKVAGDALNRLVLFWQGIDEKGIDIFYSIYTPDNNVWTKDLRLTEDKGMDKDFKGVFASDGTLHLVYNKENLDTKANDLYHLTYELSTDLSIFFSDISISPSDPSPGSQITLIGKVENTEDTTLKDVPVSFYLGDPNVSGQLIGTTYVNPSILAGGEKGEASISWTIPTDISTYKIYAVVDPQNTIAEKNEANNTAWFDILKPDLEAIQVRLEELGDGSVDIIAVIKNNGFVSAKDVEVLYKAGEKSLGVITLPAILPGNMAEVSYRVWPDIDFAGVQTKVEVIIDPQSKIVETIEDNNSAFTMFIMEPHIHVLPMSHDFEGIDLGKSSMPKAFTISNTGNIVLNIETMAFKDIDTSAFKIQNDYCSVRSLSPSDTCTFEVVFSHLTSGPKTAQIEITSSDPDNPLTSITLTGHLPGEYLRMLSKGWNFISLPVQPDNPAIASVLDSVKDKVRIVWGYDNQAKAWLKWKPAPNSALASLDAGKGYWIYLDDLVSLTIKGSDVSSNVSLYEGWNLIGYSGSDNKDITQGLGMDIAGKWIAIWNWENGTWKAKAADTSFELNAPPLDVLNRGKAYWIKMNTAQPVGWAQ